MKVVGFMNGWQKDTRHCWKSFWKIGLEWAGNNTWMVEVFGFVWWVDIDNPPKWMTSK